MAEVGAPRPDQNYAEEPDHQRLTQEKETW